MLSPNNDPLLLSALIKSMGEMDLYAQDDCFASWLAQKSKQRNQSSSSSQRRGATKSKYEIESIEQLESMSAEQVDALLKKLLKNKSAFEKWQERKATEESKRLEEVAKRRNELKRKQDERKKKEIEAQARRTNAIMAWRAGKKMETQIQSKTNADKRAMEEREHAQRQEESRKAYQEWLNCKQKETDIDHQLDYQHQQRLKTRPMWVNIQIPDQNEQNYSTGSRTRLASNQILSPPNLYNDYMIYKKHAPEFFTKYKLLVASGGVEKEQDAKHLQERHKRKPPRK